MLPPEIRQQQAPAPPQVPMLMAAGQAAPNPLAMLIEAVQPAMGALLVPIAQAGKALQSQVGELEAQAGGATPPEPPLNPAEGQGARPVA